MLLITQIYQGPPIWWTGKSWTRIVPKTMAIITGEFNIDDLFPNGNQVFGQNEAVYIIFLIFVIFCCHIVLMNVFTGLAVGDVATVMRIVFWLFYLSWPHLTPSWPIEKNDNKWSWTDQSQVSNETSFEYENKLWFILLVKMLRQD